MTSFDDSFRESTQSGNPLLAVTTDVDQNAVGPILGLPLDEGAGEILDGRQCRPPGPDQQTEVVAHGGNLHGVLVDLRVADLGVKPEFPDQAGDEISRGLPLLLECQ